MLFGEIYTLGQKRNTPMEKLKFAIIGTGNIAKVYAQIISQSPFLEIEAVVGNSIEKTKEFANLFGGTAYYFGDYKNMFLRHPGINAAIIATPEWIRMKPILACIEAEKPFLYEKPLASTLDEAKKIYTALRNYSRVTMPSFNLRFSPHFAMACDICKKGDIGLIRHFSSRRNGNREIAKRVSDKINLCYWLSPHEIDLMRWFSEDEVTWVEAHNRINSSSLDNYLMAHFHFEKGFDAQHLSSWCLPPLSNFAPQSMFEIFGTEGMIAINDNAIQSILFKNEHRTQSLDTSYVPQVHGQFVGSFQNMINYFTLCLIRNQQPKITLEDAFQSIRVCAAMERSIKEDRRVYLEELTVS